MKLPQNHVRFFMAIVGSVVLSAPSVRADIALGQSDDFEDDTLMNWNGSFLPATLPMNISTGGPAGAGDNYLQITSSGGGGPGSKLATYNQDQWIGDYTTAGVTSIDVDVRNFSSSTVELRVLLFGGGGEFASAIATPVVNDGFWHHLTLGVGAADLVPNEGADPLDVSLTLADVSRLMLRHQIDVPGESPSFVGQIGIDNVTATPEPTALAMLLIGGVAIFRRRR